MSSPISPLAPKTIPAMPPIAGVRLATAAAGIRYRDRTDVMLAVFDEGTSVAGVFTRSKCPSAPVEWCRARVRGARARALVVNSGNANAFTGKSGREACALTAKLAAAAVGCKTAEVFLASTGVIGEPLPAQAFDGVLSKLVAAAAPDAYAQAARAIMTTDTFVKLATAHGAPGRHDGHHQRLRQGRRHDRARHGDHAGLRLHRCADRGAGIADVVARRRRRHLQRRHRRRRHLDFGHRARFRHRRGARGATHYRAPHDPRLVPFRKAFNAVLGNLAEQVARDGEGARKLVEIVVEGAVSKTSARRIALSIANSPLVKTAIGGEDANWGRVVMAVGKAGEPADRDRLSIWFGGIRVAHKGARDPAYDEAAVSAAMKKPEIALKVALGLGKGRDRVLTCDLTKEYVAINGDYRS